MNKRVFLAKEDQYYSKLGIGKKVDIWEDGLRTSGDRGSYEWWYFDAEYNNGCRFVVIFYTKDRFDVKGPGKPTATLDVTLPNGQTICRTITEENKNIIDASRERCDVKIGDSFIKYQDGNYYIHFEDTLVQYDCVMKSTLPMYRPKTGYTFFGENENLYFGWLVPQPSAEASGQVKVNGLSMKLEGNGYHDHNWGNVQMDRIINHWYWCRAKIGPYTIVANDIISEKKYDYLRSATLFIAKNEEVLVEDENKIKIERNNTKEHNLTEKFIDNNITFIYVDENETKYTIEFIREKDIFASSLLNVMGLSYSEILFSVSRGINPTYLRCIGKARLTIESSKGKEVLESDALWEQMFFGNNKIAYIAKE